MRQAPQRRQRPLGQLRRPVRCPTGLGPIAVPGQPGVGGGHEAGDRVEIGQGAGGQGPGDLGPLLVDGHPHPAPEAAQLVGPGPQPGVGLASHAGRHRPGAHAVAGDDGHHQPPGGAVGEAGPALQAEQRHHPGGGDAAYEQRPEMAPVEQGGVVQVAEDGEHDHRHQLGNDDHRAHCPDGVPAHHHGHRRPRIPGPQGPPCGQDGGQHHPADRPHGGHPGGTHPYQGDDQHHHLGHQVADGVDTQGQGETVLARHPSPRSLRSGCRRLSRCSQAHSRSASRSTLGR